MWIKKHTRLWKLHSPQNSRGIPAGGWRFEFKPTGLTTAETYISRKQVTQNKAHVAIYMVVFQKKQSIKKESKTSYSVGEKSILINNKRN